MGFWATDYQELEWEGVLDHGGREDLYEVGLGTFIQAFIKTINDDQ